MRLLAILALAVGLATSAAAQRGGSSGGHMAAGGHAGSAPHGAVPAFRQPLPSFSQPRGRSSLSRSGYGDRFNRNGPHGSQLWPLFGDYDLSLDDLYASGYPIASQPSMIPLQDALAMINFRNNAGAPDFGGRVAAVEPLMIELQGDRYVQVKAADAGVQPVDLASSDSGATVSVTRQPPVASARPQDIPPAILIFRDGHSEQVRDYTIADGVLYARGDFYTDGYWNEKIELASLNVPETLQANNARNAKFVLPSLPNEVITRF